MKESGKNELVSACGIYCGACHRYLKGKCPGCAENNGAQWCKIRTCTAERGYHTCAECSEFNDVHDCRKFNTLMGKLFSLVFRSDRRASIALIAEIGTAEYARTMGEKKQSVLKKGAKLL